MNKNLISIKYENYFNRVFSTLIDPLCEELWIRSSVHVNPMTFLSPFTLYHRFPQFGKRQIIRFFSTSSLHYYSVSQGKFVLAMGNLTRLNVNIYTDRALLTLLGHVQLQNKVIVGQNTRTVNMFPFGQVEGIITMVHQVLKVNYPSIRIIHFN